MKRIYKEKRPTSRVACHQRKKNGNFSEKVTRLTQLGNLSSLEPRPWSTLPSHLTTIHCSPPSLRPLTMIKPCPVADLQRSFHPPHIRILSKRSNRWEWIHRLGTVSGVGSSEKTQRWRRGGNAPQRKWRTTKHWRRAAYPRVWLQKWLVFRVFEIRNPTKRAVRHNLVRRSSD